MTDAKAGPVAPGSAATTQARFSLGDHDPEPAPGVIGERYEIGRLLGRGATSRVFRAYDRETGTQVAIKLFHPENVALDEHRRLQEIRILGALRHPGLVELYDAGSEDGQAFLSMELVEGPNLADRIAMGRLTAAEVTGLASSLADTLAYVHARGVTHRDLKPANILLDDARPLISDFGIAQAFDSTRVTATGAVVGTAAYMAPEQVLGDKVGPPADIYALGLMLLECLTGVREYKGTMVESAVVRLHRPPRIPAGLPLRLEDLLRQMTSLRPDARPGAETVVRALRDTDRTVILTPVSPAPSPETSPSPTPGRRRRGLALAGLPVLAAAIAAGATLLLHQPETTITPSQSPGSASVNPAPGTPAPAAGPSPAAASIVVVPAATGPVRAAVPAPPPPKDKSKPRGLGGNTGGDGNGGKGRSGND
jgi:serine/threonine protein kinase